MNGEQEKQYQPRHELPRGKSWARHKGLWLTIAAVILSIILLAAFLAKREKAPVERILTNDERKEAAERLNQFPALNDEGRREMEQRLSGFPTLSEAERIKMLKRLGN